MKHVLLIACTVVATAFFTACEDASPAEKTVDSVKKTTENISKKPAGVPSKVYKQIKGFEQKHNKDVQKQLDKM
jgi:hypothetical protein